MGSSWTFYFNSLSVILTGAAYYQELITVQVAFALVGLAIGNLVLRKRTKTGVTVS